MTFHDWAGRIEVLDRLGNRIDQVRAVREEDGGVRVRILGTVEGGSPAVTGWSSVSEATEVVEFEAFVHGGRIAYKPPAEWESSP